MMALNSPVRLIHDVGVTTTAPQNATSIFGDPAGAHYRTLSMFFMFQKIKEHFVLLSHSRPVASTRCPVGIIDAVL